VTLIFPFCVFFFFFFFSVFHFVPLGIPALMSGLQGRRQDHEKVSRVYDLPSSSFPFQAWIRVFVVLCFFALIIYRAPSALLLLPLPFSRLIFSKVFFPLPIYSRVFGPVLSGVV